MQEAAREVDRRCVGPVEVVQDEHHRLGRREPFEQLAHCAIRSVALGLDRDATAAPDRGEHLSQLAPDVVLEPAQPARVDALDVRVESVDEDPERDVSFELGGRPAQHDVPPGIRAIRQLSQQPGLADPRGADDLDGPRVSGRELVERVVEPPQLRNAPYEVCGELLDGSSPRLYAGARRPKRGMRTRARALRSG